MNLRDYLFGRPITLASPLRKGDVIDRINQAANVRWWQIPVDKIVGRARPNLVVLRYASFFEYDGKPILIGQIDDQGDGCRLRLSYRAPAATTVFMIFWYAFLFIMTLAFIFIGTDQSTPSDNDWVPYLVLPLLFVAPAVMHLIGTRNADNELEELLMFLRDTVLAR